MRLPLRAMNFFILVQRLSGLPLIRLNTAYNMQSGWQLGKVEIIEVDNIIVIN